MRKNAPVLAWAMIVVSLATLSMAAVPPLIAYQGRLTSPDGNPFTGAKLVRFNIYDGAGTQVWSSGFITVDFQSGLFAVRLGESPQPALPTGVYSDSLLSLGITVDTDLELTPRTRFTTQPFAYHAVEAEVAYDVPAGSIDGSEVDRTQVQLRVGSPCPSGQFIRSIDEYGNVTCGTPLSIAYSAGPGIEIVGSLISLDSKGCSAGYVLKWNGSDWDCVAETGDISAVTGGSGLAGGGTSGDVTIWIPDEGVGYTKIDTGAVRTSEILDQTITNADISTTADISASKIAGTAATLSATNNLTGTNTFSGITRVSGIGASLRVGDSTFYANSTGVRIGDNEAPVSSSCLRIDRNCNTADARYAQEIWMINDGSGVTEGIHCRAIGDGLVTGVFARADGDASNRIGVQGVAISRTEGLTTGYTMGVSGISYDGAYSYGVIGWASRGTYRYGVHGTAAIGPNWYAGYFDGNAHVTGTLSKGAGSFKIDHPLDPENKYLQHSFVESPDMMNVYNGNVVTDASGAAVVALPDYFEALNKDFRYQLTVIGQFAQAIVAEEIVDNRFTIRTDKPNVKVSWQVTGIRKDPYANANRIEVEVAKNADERGKYAHPEAWGRDASAGVDHERSVAAAAGSKVDRSTPDVDDPTSGSQE